MMWHDSFGFGLKEDLLDPFFVADPFVLQTTFGYIKKNYGSVEAYLIQQANVRQDTLIQIQTNLLL